MERGRAETAFWAGRCLLQPSSQAGMVGVPAPSLRDETWRQSDSTREASAPSSVDHKGLQPSGVKFMAQLWYDLDVDAGSLSAAAAVPGLSSSWWESPVEGSVQKDSQALHVGQ